MIGKLTGVIEMRGPDHVLLDVRGVGYIVYVSERTLTQLPGPGEGAALYTELVVREDLMQLFGFLTVLEKEWHRVLTSVQGVGAKASLAILGALGPEGVSRAIALGDSAALRKAPGVGPKLALRLAHELKDKAPALMAAVEPASQAAPLRDAPADLADITTAPPVSLVARPDNSTADAMSALANLGYGPADAARAVAEAQASDPGAGTAGLIRAALRLLAPKG